jgi:hypothetical protein
MTRSLSALALAVVLAAAGCSNTNEFSDAVFLRNLEQWRTNGPPSYSYRVTRTCVCEGPTGAVIVEVRNGVVVSRKEAATMTDIGAQFASGYPAVEGLFDIIDQARKDRVFSMRSEYHSELGYPISIQINRTPARADDDLTYAASDLTAVTP